MVSDAPTYLCLDRDFEAGFRRPTGFCCCPFGLVGAAASQSAAPFSHRTRIPAVRGRAARGRFMLCRITEPWISSGRKSEIGARGFS